MGHALASAVAGGHAFLHSADATSGLAGSEAAEGLQVALQRVASDDLGQATGAQDVQVEHGHEVSWLITGRCCHSAEAEAESRGQVNRLGTVQPQVDRPL